MQIGRTLPPAAAPIGRANLVSGIRGILAGPRELERFQSELRAYFGVKHCFLVSSGKAAFTLILQALKELSPDRGEVLVPAFTCYSVPASVARAGLRIRLCDMQPESLDFDFAQLSEMLPQRTGNRQTGGISGGGGPQVLKVPEPESAEASKNRILAVVPTHLFGIPADVPRLRKLVKGSGIAIVEDAAQAMGEEIGDGKAGTLGDVSFFSLGRGKALSTVEGGVILTDRDDIAEVLRRLVGNLPGYGLLSRLKLVLLATALMLLMHPRLFWIPCSMPILRLGVTLYETDFSIRKMSSFQAGLTRNWQAKLGKLREGRKANVDRWIDVLARSTGPDSYFHGSRSQGLLRLPLRVADRDKRRALLRESARMGLGIMPVYPTSIDAIPQLRGMFEGETFPVADGYARELVTVPVHSYVTARDIQRLNTLILHVLT